MGGSKSSKKKSSKKSSKKSKRRRRRSSSTSSSSSGSDSSRGAPAADVWVERTSSVDTISRSEHKSAPISANGGSVDWLQCAGIAVSEGGKERRREKQQHREQDREEQRQKQEQELERLSWKPDSSGSAVAPVGSTPRAAVVGDGGNGWMLRALERARQQAAEQGRSVESIIAERWGSMHQFNEMLQRSSAAKNLSSGSVRVGGSIRGAGERSEGSRFGRSSWKKSGDGEIGSRGHRSHRYGSDKRLGDDSRSQHSDTADWRPTQSRNRHRSRSRSRDRQSRTSPGQRSSNRNRSRDRKSRASPSPPVISKRSRSQDRKSRVSPSRHSRNRSRSMEKQSMSTSPNFKSDNNDSVKSYIETTSTREDRERDDGDSIQASTIQGSGKLPDTPLSGDQLNALAARVVKAELNGDLDQAEQLRAQLESARALSSAATPSGVNTNKHQRQQQQRSREVVVMAPKGPSDDGASDGGPSLRELVRRERLGVTGDVGRQRRLDREAARHRSITARRDFTLDDAYEDVAAKFERDADKRDADATERELQKRALQRHLAESECNRCLNSSRTPRHLMCAVLEHCYLALPASGPLVPGHCLLVPSQHAVSWIQAEPEAWSQQLKLRAALQRMWAARGCELVVFECARRVKSRCRQHAVLHAIPIPVTSDSQGEDSPAQLAPIFFHKALAESESGEWNINRSVVKLRDKSLTDCIPPQLDYFYVDFAGGSGLAHVIEDADRFPATFGEEVLAGLLELGPESWRRSKPQSFGEQCERVNEFCRQWSDYDITRESERKEPGENGEFDADS